MLQPGTIAPDFTLPDKNGRFVSLSDFRGKKVVLYFYAKDSTPGCARQACGFAAAQEDFSRLDTVVIGISRDSAASHLRFAEAHHLPFVLLSDPDAAVLRLYGVWQEKKMYGRVSMGVVRSSFLVDEAGVILQSLARVKPDANAGQVLAFLRAEGGKTDV